MQLPAISLCVQREGALGKFNVDPNVAAISSASFRIGVKVSSLFSRSSVMVDFTESISLNASTR